ncbi:Protein serine/threonine phosphatase PrpC, regulation of stationary phase [Lachnospiraceae bacterium TWA4]|nr:Protein serine/threonine phosphatase PrpC, regulation of stationary phase [Lachnospiraceae bacterium TWA4]
MPLGGGLMKICAKTDQGRRRRMNQDAVFATSSPIGPLPNLAIVADGMGGHRAGDYASKYTINRMRELITQTTFTEDRIVFLLKDSISIVNQELLQKGMLEEEYFGMGTTIVSCSIEPTERIVTIANVGDSRLYFVLENELKQITKDHSLVAALVATGELDINSDVYKNNKNIITRAVGVEPTVDVDIFQLSVEDNVQLLLCSDGLTTMLEDKEILDILKQEGSLEQKVDWLIDEANQKGGYDNISVILINPEF